MKYISFSFDDGRKDTYSVVYPILSENGLTCTVNVITDFINNPEKYARYGLKDSMSVNDVLEMQKNGNEIACHGHTHGNTVSDVRNCITTLKSFGVNVDNIGFASPFSQLVPNNVGNVKELLDDNSIAYVRTGIQIRREGLIYSALMFLCEKLEMKRLFTKLNKRAIYSYPLNQKIILGVSITNRTTVAQIMKLIESMADESAVVLIFHSILERKDCYDRWCWSRDNFKLLCDGLTKKEDCRIVNTNELFGE